MLLMGKSTISMAIFNSKLLVYQRVILPIDELIFFKIVKTTKQIFTKRNPSLLLVQFILQAQISWILPNVYSNLPHKAVPHR